MLAILIVYAAVLFARGLYRLHRARRAHAHLWRVLRGG